MHAKPEAILSLLATILVAVVFVMMVNETIEVSHGVDPITNRVRALVRRFPRVTYVAAVLIGMVLGHLFWP